MVDGIQDQQQYMKIPVAVDRVGVLPIESRDLGNIAREEVQMGCLILRMHKLHPHVEQNGVF